jgi:molybdate transport system substrate-binding protein
MPDLKILSGGAAHGLVQALTPDFTAKAGLGVNGDFGAVGGLRKRLVEGESCDLVILTAAILKEFAEAGIVRPETVMDIGGVPTSVAVRAGYPAPPVGDGEALRAALLRADAIYFPDPELATAGIHFQGVVSKLGILDAVRARLKTFPNGATAMKALAASTAKHPIGCTQATEIVATAGVTLVAPLPGEHALSTVYTAGVAAASAHPVEAALLAGMLSGKAAAETRRRCAFA